MYPPNSAVNVGSAIYHAKTLDAIDRLLEGDHQVKENFNVEVVSLEAL